MRYALDVNTNRLLAQSLMSQIDDIDMNTLFARSVLTQDSGGWVFANREADPSAWYIAHSYGMSLLFGDSMDEHFQNDLKNYFQQICKDEWVQAYPDSWNTFMRAMIDLNSGEEHTRLNFEFNELKFHAKNDDITLTDFHVERTPMTLIGELNGTVVPRYFWKAERYGDCVGYTVFVDGKPASTAFSSFIHGNKLELGIETAEEYRCKGLARLACVALIRYCLKRKLTPIWSCRESNISSYKLAQSLGFIKTKQTPYYHIPARLI